MPSNQVSEFAPVPDLIAWHHSIDPNVHVNLRVLAGLEWPDDVGRGRPELVGASAADIDAYLADPGSVAPFKIYAMSDAVLDDKISAAYLKGTQLGLVLRFDKRDVALRRAEHVRMIDSSAGITKLLASPPLSRATAADDGPGAQRDLCAPAGLASFYYRLGHDGFAANLATAKCLDIDGSLGGNGITGFTFRDRVPDTLYRYVPIHEIGHTFGLCHADGAHRVMLATRTQSWFNWATLPGYWLSGGPGFTYAEAKAVWDYILLHFSAACLARRQFD